MSRHQLISQEERHASHGAHWAREASRQCGPRQGRRELERAPSGSVGAPRGACGSRRRACRRRARCAHRPAPPAAPPRPPPGQSRPAAPRRPRLRATRRPCSDPTATRAAARTSGQPGHLCNEQTRRPLVWRQASRPDALGSAPRRASRPLFQQRVLLAFAACPLRALKNRSTAACKSAAGAPRRGALRSTLPGLTSRCSTPAACTARGRRPAPRPAAPLRASRGASRARAARPPGSRAAAAWPASSLRGARQPTPLSRACSHAPALPLAPGPAAQGRIPKPGSPTARAR